MYSCRNYLRQFFLADWLLISVAAYRALWQFVTARFTWEKTEHGLARKVIIPPPR
jgi:hypothetical protein